MSARLFAALELPPEVRAGLVAFGREAAARDRALRPTREDALHLTLAFLGHRALDEIDPACEAVRAVAGAPAPVLSLADPLWLAPRRPHVLTVGLEDPSGGLARIHAAVLEAMVREAGHEAGARAFRPHVTVARVRGQIRPFELPGPPPLEFQPPAVTLYRSRLGRGPARYEQVASVPLSTLS